MTRSDILLDTKDTLKEMDDAKLSTKAQNHVGDMSDILDGFWLLMLKLEEDDNLSPLGQIMRKIFYMENK